MSLKDYICEMCTPKGRRNGKQPNEKMQAILKKGVDDARSMTSKVFAGFIIALYLNA